jgi:hypothetical protein
MKKIASFLLCSGCYWFKRHVLCFLFGCAAFDEMCNRIDRELGRAER